jgi:hypothetical protein
VVKLLDRALNGSKRYWTLVIILLSFIAAGTFAYLHQFQNGLGVTGMSRDVSWGFYISQFTFLVGVAASAVMLVIPYYLHNYKKFSKIVILGEFLAVASVTMCMLFIFVDMGQPMRILNVILHPTPNSILFWDAIVLNGLDNTPCREKADPSSWMGKALDLSFHPLGDQYSYCYGISLCRTAGQAFLAHSDHGSKVSGISICRRTCTADHPCAYS